MTPTVRRALLASLPAAALLCSVSASHAQGDPDVVKRIINEGKNNSKTWVYLTYLSEEIGPRLTGSARLERANNWMRDMFESFGCTNAHLMQWGEIPVRFDRGPSFARMTKPVEREFEFTARSWSAGTLGAIKGKVVKQPTTMEELEAMKDDLKGAWVLAKPTTRGNRRGVGGGDGAPPPPGGAGAAGGAAGGDRNAAPGDAGAAGGARGGNAPPAGGAAGDGNAPPRRGQGGGGGQGGAGGPGGAAGQNEELVKALYAAGIAGRIMPSTSDLVITGGATGWRTMNYDELPTEVSITVSRKDYDAINSRLSDGEQVEIEAKLDHHFTKGPIPLYNTVAEIQGTEFPEQVVIVSAHLDSWDGPGAMGSQDNGTGSTVTLEAARILNAVGAKPRRTIRFILWTGEEQGLLGSKGYLDSLSDEEKANISVVLVDDGGTNYQGGLVCVENMKDMLTKATEAVNPAFPDMKVDILVRERMPRGGGSDHATFNAAGIPGFFWEEDGLGGREGKNYTYVHHTQYDTPRFAVPEYLVQSATCTAVTAYNLAMADTMLPRYVAPSAAPADTGPFTPTAGPLTGTWTGAVIRDGVPTEFTQTLTLEHSTEGKLRGKMYSRFGETAMSKLAYNADTKELTFVIDSDFGSTSYAMKLSGDGELTGTSTREGREPTPFNAKRDTTEIKPPPAPASADGGAAPAGAGQQGQRPAGGRRGGAGNAGGTTGGE